MSLDNSTVLRAPGDVLLVDYRNESDVFLPFPTPTNDPNDPLNWSAWRKTLNYGLISAQTVAVFTALSIQTVFWQQMAPDMRLTYEVLNNAQSANLAGLAVGCIFFIPLAKKYGRRSTYLLSTLVMAAVTWWCAYMHTKAELFITSLFHGLAGAANEAIVQVTIADMFFIHQRGTMNALYLTSVMIGSFLCPMAAGAQATVQDWRKSYLTLAICLTIVFFLFLFGYEESKYVPIFSGSPDQHMTQEPHVRGKTDIARAKDDTKTLALSATLSNTPTVPELNTYKQRLRWITPTSESLGKVALSPAYVIFFPHVIYTALQYACGVTCLILQAAIIAMIFPGPPYNFTPAGIGYMSAGPFVGNVLGSFYTGFLSDRSIRWLAKRNGGYFEPEMRLYLLLLPVLLISGGQIMFGMTVERGMHWIYPSVGGAFFAFGLGAISDAAFTLVIDAYQPLTAEAFVGITFVRNAVGIPIPFAITPWLRNMGIQNMFLISGFVSLAITLLFVPMIIWGKRMRAALATRYNKLLEKQGNLMAN